MITEEKFRKYLEVQISGFYNMNSAEAREATGLNQVEYNEIKWNYTKYREKFPGLFEEVKQEYIENLDM